MLNQQKVDISRFPVHGSAPDITGQDIANPIGQIGIKRFARFHVWAVEDRRPA